MVQLLLQILKGTWGIMFVIDQPGDPRYPLSKICKLHTILIFLLEMSMALKKNTNRLCSIS
jgi:hypothetical protein